MKAHCAGPPRSFLGYGQDLLPPSHHPVRFRKEPVTAQIHSIAAVVDGLGDSTNLGICFKDYWRDVRSPQELEGRSQPRRPGADYDGYFHVAGSADRTFLQSYR